MSFSLDKITFDDPRILPIKAIEELDRGEGVSAVVHKIILYGDYDDLKRPVDHERSDRLVVSP